MAKKSTSGKKSIDGQGGKTEGGETTAGYFRAIFKKKPELLGERSNEPLLQQWLKDHPDQTEVPKSVKANLANLKSALRSKGRKKQGKEESKQAAAVQDWLQQPRARPRKAAGRLESLESLERHIDDCLIEAAHLDRDGLEDVINHLRRARNSVVWKIGQ